MVIAVLANCLGVAAVWGATVEVGSIAAPGLLAQAQDEPHFQIERLDPLSRTKALAALTALIVLMFGLMVLASLGARWARNYGRRSELSFERRLHPPPPDPDDWASKPLQPPELSDSSGNQAAP